MSQRAYTIQGIVAILLWSSTIVIARSASEQLGPLTTSLFLLSLAGAEPARAEANFVAQFNSDKTTYSSGDAILLNAEITNTGDASATIAKTSNGTVKLRVKLNGKRQKPRKTYFNSEVSLGVSLIKSLVEVAPGQTVSMPVEGSRGAISCFLASKTNPPKRQYLDMYLLSTPGTYEVSGIYKLKFALTDTMTGAGLSPPVAPLFTKTIKLPAITFSIQ